MLHECSGQSGGFRAVTKWWQQATTVEAIPWLVREAFAQLGSGRPRPAALEIPCDVEIETERWRLKLPEQRVHIDIDPAEIGRNYGVSAAVVGHAKPALEGMLELCRGADMAAPMRPTWSIPILRPWPEPLEPPPCGWIAWRIYPGPSRRRCDSQGPA